MRTALFMLTAVLFIAGPAAGELSVCNETGSEIYVALGYYQNDAWYSAGWWKIRRAACRTLTDGDLAERYYYIYAHSPDGSFKLSGNYEFCIHQTNPFEVPRDTPCRSKGFDVAGFQQVDTADYDDYEIRIESSGTRAGPR